TAAAAAPASVPPRKRRRRAPATGATEDCFTCRKRKTQCDRRRPYCTQCIDLGKECSGYRTTLTWGVGVASRGKLRGKTLPIANSPKAAGVARKGAANVTSPPLSASARSNSTASEVDIKQELQSPAVSATSYGSTPALEPQRSTPQCSSPTAMSAVSMPSGSNPNFAFAAATGNFQEPMDGYYGMQPRRPSNNFRPRPLQRLQTHLSGTFDDSAFSAPSTGSVSTFSDSDFPPSPTDYPHTPDEVPFADPFINSFPDPYTAHHSTPSSGGQYFMEAPRSYPSGPHEDLSSSISSDFKAHYHDITPSPQVIPEGFDYVFGPQPVRNSAVTSHPKEQDAADVPSRSSFPSRSNSTTSTSSAITTFIPQSLDSSPFRHLSSRLQALLGYYDRMICPVLVAFDGPSNPYRMHIMHLAVGSEGLQNAIAALATNNFRMRQLKELNDSSGQVRTVQEIEMAKSPASAEEQQYKARSIATLNALLADTTSAKHDSVLATLLILCLFHVCDTGFSKFKTQLAGVQKLLSMRKNDRSIHNESQDGFIAWVEMFFTWFDVMNSTVNDRETEVRGDSLDMVNLSANLGSLEHLAGCEGRLFKLIARLGRLNLLSQERPVRDEPAHVTTSSQTSSKKHSPDEEATPRSTPKLRVTNLDYYNLDGNGWGTPISSEDATPTPIPGTPTSALRSTLESTDDRLPDSRRAFWKEWHRIRSRLDAWTFPSDSLGFDALPGESDMSHISHAFHAAALLYTERLASPTLPPSAPALQGHVRSALAHISTIPADSCVNKFLLWPLFIAGTECVEWSDRELVRARIVCVTRESGFFNNMAGLGLLERIWADDDEGLQRMDLDELLEGEGARQLQMRRTPFRWRKVLGSMQGEYIVV
ncbi:hypothetical protein NA57DRAFT_19042, partial [Rhizodiscina lignyota]